MEICKTETHSVTNNMIVAFFVVAGLLNQGNALYVNSCICYTASFRFGCLITKISSS